MYESDDSVFWCFYDVYDSHFNTQNKYYYYLCHMHIVSSDCDVIVQIRLLSLQTEKWILSYRSAQETVPKHPKLNAWQIFLEL